MRVVMVVVDFVAAPFAVGRHGAARSVDAAAEERAQSCERRGCDAEAGFDDGPQGDVDTDFEEVHVVRQAADVGQADDADGAADAA